MIRDKQINKISRDRANKYELQKHTNGVFMRKPKANKNHWGDENEYIDFNAYEHTVTQHTTYNFRTEI